jgi:hypothetical protein
LVGTDDGIEGVNMVVENCVSALKRTREELKEHFNSDGVTFRQLFLDENGAPVSPGGYNGIGPHPQGSCGASL